MCIRDSPSLPLYHCFSFSLFLHQLVLSLNLLLVLTANFQLSLPVSLIHESKLATFVDDLNLLTTVSSPPHTRESQTLSLSCLDESELQTPNAVRAGHLLEDFLRRRKEDQSDEEVRGERRAGASASGESIVELWRKRKQNAVKMMEASIVMYQ
eukprot:764223-Hanusia_phi.AAC.2